jgi:hypothetical protein
MINGRYAAVRCRLTLTLIVSESIWQPLLGKAPLVETALGIILMRKPPICFTLVGIPMSPPENARKQAAPEIESKASIFRPRRTTTIHSFLETQSVNNLLVLHISPYDT